VLIRVLWISIHANV